MVGVLFAKMQPALRLSPLSRRCCVVVTLVALADWLLYGHAIALSGALFLLALHLGATLANPGRVQRPEMFLAAGVQALAVAPLLVRPSLLALLFAVLGTACAMQLAFGARVGLVDRAYRSIELLSEVTWRAAQDLYRMGRLWSRRVPVRVSGGALIGWVIPLALGAVFLLLFAIANPLIDSWLGAIDVSALLEHVGVGRIGLWLLALSAAWPFVFMRRQRKSARLAKFATAAVAATTVQMPDRLVGRSATLRSLILFNLLFAVQTGLDAVYLWGGVALPDGLTYAAYAHRGAYPLIVTALLAAAFVIVATRPGSDTARSPLIRQLVFLWTGQNVVLVVSSILRLDLYVAVYSLTYLRIAAFVWMALVGIGLVLIVLRIALSRSNGWLIGANLLSLLAALYLCSVMNGPGLIADYHGRHAREITGDGAWLDEAYLVALGPQAIPALDFYIGRLGPNVAGHLIGARERLAFKHLRRMADWRAWSLQDRKLARYLLMPPSATAASAPWRAAPD